MPGEMKLVSASGDHTARLWDVSRPNSYNEIAVYSGHTRSVKTVVFRPEDKGLILFTKKCFFFLPSRNKFFSPFLSRDVVAAQCQILIATYMVFAELPKLPDYSDSFAIFEVLLDILEFFLTFRDKVWSLCDSFLP